MPVAHTSRNVDRNVFAANVHLYRGAFDAIDEVERGRHAEVGARLRAEAATKTATAKGVAAATPTEEIRKDIFETRCAATKATSKSAGTSCKARPAAHGPNRVVFLALVWV